MRKEYRIKKNKDFQVAFKKGKSVANRQFVIYTLKKPDQNHFRIGLSVSKKIGKLLLVIKLKDMFAKFFMNWMDNYIMI